MPTYVINSLLRATKPIHISASLGLKRTMQEEYIQECMNAGNCDCSNDADDCSIAAVYVYLLYIGYWLQGDTEIAETADV